MSDVEYLTDEENFYPSPSRLAESLRDTGYSYEAAFADIVDNSIAANASSVNIDIFIDVSNSVRVIISDNGDGMDKETLLNAMRYGSPRRESPKSLGKFGMGLKTASTAFCRRLTVISKKNDQVNGRTWDIDEIIKKDRWELLTPNLSNYEEEIELLEHFEGSGSGTVVIWENIDRLISQSENISSKKLLEKLIEEIELHLCAVFGKFLDTNNAVTDNVKIVLNDKVLEGWDPTGIWLNSGENKTRVIKIPKKLTVKKEISSEVINRDFDLNGYILPNKSEMNDEELARLRYGNDNQGFYIYRENRLIYGGGWPHRLYTKESHLNLIRVELNFDHELDEYFQVDIRKTRIIFPQELREEIKNQISPLRNEANRRYRSGNKNSDATKIVSEDHSNSDRAIQKHLESNQHSEVEINDAETGKVTIKNSFGVIEIDHAKLIEGTEISVKVEDSLDDGTLWTYGIDEDGNTCVILNSSHMFYKKFYTGNKANPVLLQSMDSLFWALANAEIGTISTKAKRNIEELRFLVSKDLRNLSDELPDVE